MWIRFVTIDLRIRRIFI